MKNYDMENMKRMQQEAVRRVQEMHARAQKSAGGQPPEPPQPAPGAAANPLENILSKLPVTPINAILESFLKDSERTLILLLVFLLIDEKSDMGLILALMYLVLDV